MKIKYDLLFKISFTLMGVSILFFGFCWLFSDQPWLLDKKANLIRLEIESFDDLFHSSNQNLSDYLTQIYRFFGLWVLIIGLFIIVFSIGTISESRKVRVRLLVVVGILIFISSILGYVWIPDSPFIYLSWCMVFIYLIGIYSHKNYKIRG